MSKKKSEDGPITGLITTIVALPFAAVLTALGVAAIFVYRPFNARVGPALRLRQLSRHVGLLKWLTIPLGVVAGGVLLFGALSMYKAGLVLYGNPIQISDVGIFALATLLTVIGSLVLGIVLEIHQLHDDAEVQQSLAGEEAEKFVRKLLEKKLKTVPAAQSLHGSLMVFNRGKDDEFSLETDHLLITPQNIFIIETKYKSGTIYALRDAGEWEVSHHGKTGAMRNALKQAQNAAKVLKHQFDLPCDVIPVVAIKGQEVTIKNAPINVTTAENIFNVVDLFESHSAGKSSIDVQTLLARLQEKISVDEQDWKDHIQRAQRSSQKAEIEQALDF